ncbi:DUF6531 domain-containing protein [Conexibacter sp. CPCC 206217]|uniref:DUF6531 domain-containing protein n=1 Tax=Conexibacter sp. CPCC 206217 TaxID=3064574 RepID=UPI002718A127|nr:RHS repeat protein [Conexibacter sp. CPCC 206217]MDO8213917.1 DUF6531 domain-containing protein [Conexibacter sp. CPCC 206217]
MSQRVALQRVLCGLLTVVVLLAHPIAAAHAESVETTTYNACRLRNGFYSGSSSCGTSVFSIGPSRNQSGQIASVERAVMLPNIGGIPRGAQAIDGTFSFGVLDNMDAVVQVGLFSLTRTLGSRPSWATSDGTTPWTTPGGDYETAPEVTRSIYVTGGVGTTATINYPIGRLAAGWLDGGRQNQGLLLKVTDEAYRGVAISPRTVSIRYRMRTGLDEAAYSYERRSLSDGSELSVNLGNGNVVLTNDDFGDGGTGDALAVTRAYNSLDDASAPGTFGRGWRGDFGTVTLEHNAAESSVILNGPTGVDSVFRRPYGSFGAWRSDDATLTEQVSARTMTLSFDDSDEQWLFEHVTDTRLRLVRRWYPSDDGVSATYDSAGRLSALNDSADDAATFSWDGSGQMRTVTDQFGDQRHYDYDANGHLFRYTDAAGALTTYRYDANGRLASITLPDRSGMTLSYYSNGALQTLAPLAADGTPGTATTYTWDPGSTTIATPGQKTAVHQFDRALFGHGAQIGAVPPSLMLAGDLLDAGTTSLPQRALPDGPSTLSYSATSPDGIERVRVTLDGEEDDGVVANCASGCPTSFSDTYTLDTNDVGPGVHVVRVIATTTAGNRREQAFRVLVPENGWTSDGEIPEDLTETDPDPTHVMSTAPCEAVYGVEAPIYCDTEGGDDALSEPVTPLALSALAAAPHTVRFGIAQDFSSPDWLDTRYAIDLRTKYYRRILPYNLMETVDGRHFTGDRRQLKFPGEYDDFSALYEAVVRGTRDRDPAELMVSFELATCPACTGPDRPSVRIPSLARYKQYIGDFLERFSAVHVISSWNEPNAKRQPLHTPLVTRGGRGATPDDAVLLTKHGGAARAAYYTLAATQVCANWIRARAAAGRRTQCTVLAAELAQSRPPVSTGAPSHRYLLAYRRALLTLFSRRENEGLRFPGIWAFHPYTDVQNDTRDSRKATGTDLFGRALVQGRQIWLTEVGSRVDRGDTRAGNFRNTLPSQAAEVQYLFGRLVQRRRNITRMYYYSLCAPPIDPTTRDDPPQTEKFDSGLVGGRPDEGGVHGTCQDFDRPGYVAKRDAYDTAMRYMNP